MDGTEPKTTASKRQGLKILLKIAVVIAALFLIRLVIGFGTAAIHYAKTPIFEAYITSHPVAAETLEERLPKGELIQTEGIWTTGAIDPLSLIPGEGEFERADLTLLIDITRGVDTLLSLKEEFSLSLRRSDWSHHGVRIGVSRLSTASGLRAVVVTSISDPEKMVGEDSMAVGGAMVDVFLLSGQGPSESRFQLYPGGNTWSGGPGMDDGMSVPYWRLMTGITHNLKPLPEEGLIHHVRHRVSFDWKKYENGHGGPSFSRMNHGVNTDEYSYSLKLQLEGRMDGKDGGSFKSEKSMNRSWNGRIR